MSLPKDPMMLYSSVNMRLRDEGCTLEELCAAEGAEIEALKETLRAAGFEYREDLRQFR